MKQKIFDLKLYYFSVAVAVSLLTSVLPLFYESINLNPVQVGTLISTTYIGALMQPVFGYVSDKTQKPQLVLKILMMIACVLSGILYFIHSFVLVLFLVLLLSLCYCSFFSLSDNIITSYVYQNNLNYGSIRRLASLGYGMAMLIAMPFIYVWGMSAFLLVVIVVLMIAVIKIDNVDYVAIEKPHDSSYKKDLKELLTVPAFLILLLFQMLFMGTASIKFSYQAMKLQAITGATISGSVALLMATMPEVLFLAKVSKILENYRFTTLLFISVAINLLHLFTYAFVENYIVLIIIAACHGLSMSLFLPVIPAFLRQIVNLRVIGTAFALIATTQSIVSLMVSSFIITPVYATLGINYVFGFLAIIMMISLIFLARLRFKYNY